MGVIYVLADEILCSAFLLNLVPHLLVWSGWLSSDGLHGVSDFLWFVSVFGSGLAHWQRRRWRGGLIVHAGPVDGWDRARFSAQFMVVRLSYLLEPVTGFTHLHHFVIAVGMHLFFNFVLLRWLNLPLLMSSRPFRAA